MLFNSYTFLVFFAVLFPLVRYAPGWRTKKTILLLASYVFYAAWDPAFIVLLWISTVVDWFAARWIHAAPTPGRRRLFLLLSLFVNLGMLGYFKYALFFLDNAATVAGWIGFEYAAPRPTIILPIGISFFTFQTLSYTFDVFRRRIAPWTSFLDYALFVTFFPQLVAGPILRGADFLPQCKAERAVPWHVVGWGMCLLTIGLFCKVVVADELMAPIVEMVFDGRQLPGFIDAWAGVCAFSVQIFCDFAGYSTCAIGVAMTLGFDVPDNFRFPLGAVGFSDFWARWHMTLSRWVRDYVFMPLCRRRRGRRWAAFNMMLAMVIVGFWHGAAWTFVLWGAMNGFMVVIEREIRRSPLGSWRVWSRPAVQRVLWVGTYLMLCFTITAFRAHSIGQTGALLWSLLGGRGWEGLAGLAGDHYRLAFCTAAVTVVLHRLMVNTSLEAVAARVPWWLKSALLAVLMYLVLISMTGEDRAFIYFQF